MEVTDALFNIYQVMLSVILPVILVTKKYYPPQSVKVAVSNSIIVNKIVANAKKLRQLKNFRTVTTPIHGMVYSRNVCK